MNKHYKFFGLHVAVIGLLCALYGLLSGETSCLSFLLLVFAWVLIVGMFHMLYCSCECVGDDLFGLYTDIEDMKLRLLLKDKKIRELREMLYR